MSDQNTQAQIERLTDIVNGLMQQPTPNTGIDSQVAVLEKALNQALIRLEKAEKQLGKDDGSTRARGLVTEAELKQVRADLSVAKREFQKTVIDVAETTYDQTLAQANIDAEQTVRLMADQLVGTFQAEQAAQIKASCNTLLSSISRVKGY